MGRALPGRTALWVALLPLGLSPPAQGDASFKITPTITFSETYSDNTSLLPDDSALAGWTTEIVPGVRIDANGARLKGYLDYRFHQLYYTNLPEKRSSQNVLSSVARLEAIERFLFLDGRASISQQNRSAFDAAVITDRPSASANRLETRAFQLSPYARAQFPDIATLQLRYAATDVDSEGEVPRTRLGETTGRIRDAKPSARIGWAFDVHSVTARTLGFETVDNARYRGLLIYRLDPLLGFVASYGQERSDLITTVRQNTETPGVGLNWTPSPRTQVAAMVERRFFGTGHNAIALYRTPLAAFSLVSTREANILPGVLSGIGYEAGNGLQELLSAPETADSVARGESSRRRLDEVGISATFPLATGVVTAQPLLYSRQAASMTLLGVRNTFVVAFARSDQRDFGPDLLPDVRGINQKQVGISGSWAYKLTPLTSLVASATALRTEFQETTAAITNRQTLFSLAWTTRLGEKMQLTLAVRHAEFDTPTPQAGYRENAVFGSLQVGL